MENGIERIAGLLFSGLSVRLAGAALAVWIGLEAAAVFGDSLAAVSAAFEGVRK